MSPIKTAIAGFGIAGRCMHAPFLKTLPQQYEVIAVLERNRSESVAMFPNATIVRNEDEMLRLPGLELVVITTPNDSHYSYAKAALLAGKHVVIDKPFTITSADALDLIETARQVNKVISVYQNRRYVTDFCTIEEILHKKLLGDVHTYEANYPRYRPEERPDAWREKAAPGTGILYDLGAHIIDQALYLFGIPKYIFADVRMQRPHASADDYFLVMLDHGFTQVSLKAGMLVREPGPRYMLHGTLGSFIKYGTDPQEVFLRDGKLPTEVKNWGIEKEEFYGLLHTEINGTVVKEKYPSLPGNYGSYYENLYKTIRENSPLRERPEHGHNSVRLIELAFESSQQKKVLPCTGLIDVGYPEMKSTN